MVCTLSPAPGIFLSTLCPCLSCPCLSRPGGLGAVSQARYQGVVRAVFPMALGSLSPLVVHRMVGETWDNSHCVFGCLGVSRYLQQSVNFRQ